ncbi:MAG: histone-lysine N-methyltransferase, partial [candidate division KSB1 bacterium]|nr:histone-lysine N-methyltransferase [candidate division KSB1 bacterium]
DRSGIAGVGFWVNQQLAKMGKPPVDKRNPKIAAIFEWIEEEYAQGRITSISHEEMMAQFRLHFPEVFDHE